MYKICQTDQSFQRQRAIENGLLQLMQKRRYEDITISELCDHLQIPRKAFYRYFSGKDGALFALLDHTMMDFYMGSPRSGGAAPGELEQFFIFWYDHRTLLKALVHSGLSGILVERATGFALRERMMPRHMLNWDSDFQEVALSFSICGLMSMVFQWNNQGYQKSPGEMTKIAITMLTQPLLPI